MKRSTSLFFYLLSFYVLLQFAWWGFHLIQLTGIVNEENGLSTKRIFMIVGEGMVFLLILVVGIWRIRRSIRKELELSRHQNNFLLSVTHELKTPIASNKLYLQTVLKRELDTEKRNNLIEKALLENDRLEKMMDNILNASRLENRKLLVHKEEVQLSNFVTSIVDRHKKIYPEVEFKCSISPSIQTNIDPFLFESIVNNLIENAIKYAASFGPINIELEQKNTIVLRVSDFGPGVPSEAQKNIFKKFYRAGNEETRNQKGTGLGLFIAAEFTRIHKGQLKYSDNQPQGAIFELIL